MVKSLIILTTSSRLGLSICWRTFYWSLSHSISTYFFHCAKMVAIRSTSGKVVSFFISSLAWSWVTHSLASTAYIFGSAIISSQTLAHSSQRHAQSYSNFLILAIVVVFVCNLPSRTSGGIPGVVCCWRSCTYSKNLFITFPILKKISSMVASMTRGTSGTFLYKFWTTT